MNQVLEDFVGRRKELATLEKAYASSQSEFFPIYGRRRVGKSELILRFIKGKSALYFLGKRATPQLQLAEFMQEAALALHQPLLASVTVSDWKSAFKLVIDQNKSTKKLVLVLDEFQWMAQASPELPSILQGLLDQDWKKRGNIFLILCGSYMGFMEREVLGEKSPLFGRRTGQILLKPFSYLEAGLFHPSWSIADRAKAYFICGGIPLYLRFFSERHSLLKNIENNLLDEFAPLFREPDFLLKEELRELHHYYGLLMCLPSGANTNKKIAATTGIDERKIHYYMQNLVELGYVRRTYPLTTTPHSAKDVRFVLDDPLLSFWFRFIYPSMGYIAKVGPHEAFQTIIKPHLDAYFGLQFERLCGEALTHLYQTKGLSSSFEIGAYWNSAVQIDLVGYRHKDGLDIGECKWGHVGSLPRLIAELDQKMALYPNPLKLTVTKHIFSQKRLRASRAIPHVVFHDLEDLYAAEDKAR